MWVIVRPGIIRSLALQSQLNPNLTFTGMLRWLWYSSKARHNTIFSFTEPAASSTFALNFTFTNR
jgi:hypothetical protein